MSVLRSDAARSRERILAVARQRDAKTLRLNDIAREAGVGVGTVYRHFATVHALREAISYDTLTRMREMSRQAAAEADHAVALASFLRSALQLQLEDGGLQAVLLSPNDEADDVHEVKGEIFATFLAVLERARASGVVRADLSVEQLEHLVCGIEHAIRLGLPSDREPFLQILLAGIRPV